MPKIKRRSEKNMFFKEQKGQSALEYLMTYGWALIVIVIVIAALVLLIGDPNAIASGCDATLTSGNQAIYVQNYQFTTAGLSLKVANGTGRSMNTVLAQAEFDDSGTLVPSAEYTGTESISTGSTGVDVTWTGQALTTGAHTVDVNITYNDGDFDRAHT